MGPKSTAEHINNLFNVVSPQSVSVRDLDRAAALKIRDLLHQKYDRHYVVNIDVQVESSGLEDVYSLVVGCSGGRS